MGQEEIRIILLVTAYLILGVSGLLRRPGLGIMVALLSIGYVSWTDPAGLAQFGFAVGQDWWTTFWFGLVIGTLMALMSMAVLEPLVERVTGQPHDISIVDDARGSLVGFLKWLLIVWVFVALLEELVFRGYLMGEFLRLADDSPGSIVIVLMLSSGVFGLAHLYQGISGGLSSAVIGLALGVIYLASGFNLWLLILVHGVIDTVQIGLISADLDQDIRQWFLAPPG